MLRAAGLEIRRTDAIRGVEGQAVPDRLPDRRWPRIWCSVLNDRAGRMALFDSSKGKSVATSFYDLSVPTFLQTVRAVGGFLHRAARHCAETGSDPDDFIDAQLFDDMAPFHFQIEAAWHHAVWGLEAIKTGVFAPPALIGPVPFTDLRAMIGKAETALKAFTHEA